MDKGTLREYLEIALLLAAVAACLSIALDHYTGAPRTQLGSFEYIRKAEELLDKGSLQNSIRYFEKAYSESPDNDIIAAKVQNAYFRYGEILEGSGDYDKAVGCLNRAYIVMPGSRSAQRLALAYAEKAARWLGEGKAAEARADFENAVESASSYAAASRNLGIFLFNKAVVDYKAGLYDRAIIFLKESSIAYRSASVFELLGDIYYTKTDFKKARFFFGKAMVLDRGNKNIREKFKRAVIDLQLSRTRDVVLSPHFELKYDRELTINAGLMKDILEHCYSEVGRDLDYFPDSKTVIVLYSQDDFSRMFLMPGGTRAIYDGNIRMPLPDRMLTEREFTDYIYHEYTHAVVSAKTGNNAPVWLSEGIAVREEYRERSDAVLRAVGKSVDPDKLSMDSLYKAFDIKNENQEALREDYLISYSVVRYIVDNWGLSGLCGILERIKGRSHFANAVDDEFLISEKEFERRWKNYLVKLLR